jgi:hypothetical protein
MTLLRKQKAWCQKFCKLGLPIEYQILEGYDMTWMLSFWSLI